MDNYLQVFWSPFTMYPFSYGEITSPPFLPLLFVTQNSTMLQCADATDKEGGHLDVGPVSSGGDAPQLADDAQEKQKPKARSLAAGHVDRIISSALPDGMHVSRDARIAFQKAATVSLLYLSCLAGDERARESKKRVTLSANDIRAALKAAGMTHLLPMLSASNIKRVRDQDDHVV